MIKSARILTAFTLWITVTANAANVTWISTTDSERWHEEKGVTVAPFDPDKVNDVNVTRYREQTMEGFGTCLNELGWDAFNMLPQKERGKLMDELFAPGQGVGFSYCRLTIGANDYSREWYSFNETDGDFEMRNFSIKRDYDAHIPYIKAVKKANPGMRFWASPWSPPTWMKTNHHYATQSGDHNDLDKDNQVLEGDHFIQDRRYLDAFALYLSKFITAYKDEGINVEMIQFQNEPYTRNQWPTCLWTPEAMRNFIASHLGPRFEADHPEVQLWLGTINCGNIEDVNLVMNDPEAGKYIKGIGLQWEGKNIVRKISDTYPNIKLMQTENECGGGTFDWEAARHTYELLKTYIKGGVSSYMYWNAILADKGTSTWGWNQNAMVVIDSKTGKINFTPEFYLIKHLSHYVQPGASKMKTMGNDEDILAFLNPDGKTVIFVANKDNEPKHMSVGIGKNVVSFTMKPDSFNTLTFEK